MEDDSMKKIEEEIIDYNNPISYFMPIVNEAEKYMIQTNHINDIKHYAELEEKLLLCISNNKTIDEKQRKELKKILLKYLRERYESNLKGIEYHRAFQLQIEKKFNEYMANGVDFTDELLTFSQSGNIEKTQDEITGFIDYLRRVKESNFAFYLKENLQLTHSIPKFLLLNQSKLIKQRIMIIWRMNHHKPSVGQWFIVNDPEYKFLYERYGDFFDDRINIFDDKYFSKETLEILFQALYFANGEYLRHDTNVKIFLNNSRRYLDLMHFERKSHSKMVSDCFDYFIANNQSQADQKLNELFTQLTNEVGKFEDGKINEKLSFLIFCLSCVLNGVIQVETEPSIKAVFASALKCSAKEREFLFNFLTKYDSFLLSNNNKCIKINNLMENHVLSVLIKSYTKVLYDEQNYFKINFPYKRIIYLLNKSGFKSLQQGGNDTDDEEYLFSPLNDMEKDSFANLFDQFKESVHEKDDKSNKKSKKGFLSKIGSEVTSYIKYHKPMMMDKSTHLLIPVNPLNISIHICICMSGMFLQETDSMNNINLWRNLINKKESVDYYIYNWQNEDNMSLINDNVVKSAYKIVKSVIIDQGTGQTQIIENKKMAKRFGRLLAYIISSRAVFKFHTISLMGYSLGCNVIKYCLKELKKINFTIDVSDIIQNVIFLGGATTFKQKHKEIFSLVSGNVYNFFSRIDKILSLYYDENSIGYKELQFIQEKEVKTKGDGDNYIPNIINCDLTSQRFKQATYTIALNKLLRDIKYY